MTISVAAKARSPICGEQFNLFSEERKNLPYTANVLDYIGREMIATDGRQVMVAQNMRGEFMVYVAGALFESGLSNLAANRVLNRIGCRLA